MGFDAMRIGVQIRRFLFISIRTCYKSVCDHPFLVVFVLFLIFLYRSFPFLFSLLISASPVLVCTAVLLGTLLSFGEPNLPGIEVDRDEEITHEVSSLSRGVVGDSTVVLEKDGNFFVENLIGRRKDEENWEDNGVSKIKGDDGLGDYMPLINEKSREVQFGEHINEANRDFDVSEFLKQREVYEAKRDEEVLSNGKAVENHHSGVQNEGKERHQVEDPKSTGESIHNGKCDGESEEEDDDEASDSGSDGAESSSPDASMADIIPMLDELHPLLYERTPQPAKESDIESEDETEKENGEEEEEEGDDDNDNEEEEEEGQRGKDEAIKWTEDDQKNLMDLGTSELERNQRLESLIARRRARSNLKLFAEKNLIDLDGADILPHNIPNISTKRNPFDFSFDSIDDAPGSAPSILLPRRNPFDIPYDPNEEKPDLKADSFQQEFSPAPHRDMIFRRHESFSVGPSSLGGSRQDLRWRPYFVPERFGAEEMSYNTFQRQLSGASDSKLSSVPDTDSVSSAMEEEDKKLSEDVSQEADLISNLDHSSVLVERGSLSSEDRDALDLEDEGTIMNVNDNGDEIAVGEVENPNEFLSLSTSRGTTPIEVNTTEILLKMEPDEDEYSNRSSVSSLSEIDEKISDVKKGGHPGSSNGQIEESQISPQTSIDSNFHFVSEVADESEQGTPVMEPSSNGTAEVVSVVNRSVDLTTDQPKEPVYDSSPQGVEKLISFTSISSDAQGETLDNGFPLDSAEFSGKESEMVAESMDNDGSVSTKVDEPVSEERSGDENELRSEETAGVGSADSSCSGQNGKDESVNPESGVKDDLHLSSSKTGSTNEIEDNSLFQSDEEHSWSVKPKLEPCLSGREVFLDACASMKESRGEPSITASESQGDELDLKESILDNMVYEDSGHILECSEETDGPPVAEENLSEFEDAIKDIDEGLLSELDTVGDFSVGKVGSSSSTMELPVLEIRSANDLDLAFKQLGQGEDVQDVILSSTIEQHTFDLKEKHLEEIHNVMKQSAEESVEEMAVLKQGETGDLEGVGVIEEQQIASSESNSSGPRAVKFVRFTVEATEEGIIQKTEDESGDDEHNMKTPRESFDETTVSSDDTEDEKTAEDEITAEDENTAEDKKTAENKKTTEDEKTEEDVKTAEDKETAEDEKTADDKKTAEDVKTTEDNITSAVEETEEDKKTAEDKKTSEDEKTAEDKEKAEDGKTIVD